MAATTPAVSGQARPSIHVRTRTRCRCARDFSATLDTRLCAGVPRADRALAACLRCADRVPCGPATGTFVEAHHVRNIAGKVIDAAAHKPLGGDTYQFFHPQ